MVEIEEGHLSELRVRLREQIENLEASSARYDAGGMAEGNRLAVIVRVLVHDTPRTSSLLKQMGVKDELRWIDTNGGMNARGALMFTSLVRFQTRVLEEGMELTVSSVPQAAILERGKLIDFETWWRIFPIMVANGEQISRVDVVDILANQDGGAHVDLLKARFVRLLNAVPRPTPFTNEEGAGVEFGRPSAPDDGFVRAALRAAMRTIAEEVWLGWANQLDLLDPEKRDVFRSGRRIGPDDLPNGA